MSKKVVLIILDGFGWGEPDQHNPIHLYHPDNIFQLIKKYPFGLLQASGISVGLPWGEPGNSQAGHLTMGLGKVYYQHYPRITLAIRNGDFFQNQVLLEAFNRARHYNSKVHLIGLLTDSIVHASYEHLFALLELAKRINFQNLWLHLFLDGRDTDPKKGLALLEMTEKKLKELKIGNLATISGRMYGMDKEGLYQIRTQRAFRLIVEGVGKEVKNYQEYLRTLYQEPYFIDEKVEPLVINKKGIVENNDVLIFFNFREDGMRQLARAFCDPDFKEFSRPPRENLYFVWFVQYLKELEVPVAFPNPKIETHLTKEISKAGFRQIKIGEKAKSTHITYFFNGLTKEPYPEEYWKIFPASPDPLKKNPLMRSVDIENAIIEALKENIYQFILANFAAPDVVAHTGDFALAKKIIEYLNEAFLRIEKAVLEEDAVCIITADHGNLEKLVSLAKAIPETRHDPSPVPCWLIAKEFQKEKNAFSVSRIQKEIVGTLIDIAPTVLSFLNLPIPPSMKGKNLLKILK